METVEKSYRITLRDALLLVVGAAGMWGTQVATQWRTQSAIETLSTKVDGYQQLQMNENSSLQMQVDGLRRATDLNVVDVSNAAQELSKFQGILIGAGIRGASLVEIKPVQGGIR